MSANYQPTIANISQIRHPRKRKAAVGSSHPGQAHRSERKKVLQALRKPQTAKALAEGTAYRERQLPVQYPEDKRSRW